MRVLTVVGNRPQFVKAAAVSRLLRADHDECSSTPASTTTTSSPRCSSPSSASRRPIASCTWHGDEHRPDLADARGARAARRRGRTRCGARVRRHQLHPGGRARRRAGGRAGGARRGRDALVRSGDARGAQSRAHRPPVRPAAVSLADRRREPRARGRRRARRARRRRHGRRGAAGPAEGGRAAASVEAPEGFVLATAHRAGNVDDPARLGRLVALLEAVPHPVVLPLHPRTRARAQDAGLLARLEAAATIVPPLAISSSPPCSSGPVPS